MTCLGRNSHCRRCVYSQYVYVISVILLLFVQTIQILQFPVINVLEIFGGYVLFSRQSHLMFLFKNMMSTVHFSIRYGAYFFEYFSLSPNCTGIRTGPSGNFTRNLRRVSEHDFLLFIYVL